MSIGVKKRDIELIEYKIRRLQKQVCCKDCIELTDCTDGQVPAWDDLTQTWVCGDPSGQDLFSLNADLPTQDSANLVGQELQLNPATDTTYGVMSPSDKAKLDDLSGIERTITVVANYAALPDPTTVPDEFYFAEASQGTSWLPGGLGGTYRPAGLYYSTGAAWITDINPWQATQTDVDAGIITDQFVSPATLFAASTVSHPGHTHVPADVVGGYTVLAEGRPVSSFTNSVTSDQDFATLYTVTANYLTAGRTIRVTILYETTTGVSTATATIYLKLGGTKVYIPTAADFTNSLTRSGVVSIDITGTAAAGAAVAVHTGVTAFPFYTPAEQLNTVSYSQNQATNGGLAITAGVTYSSTGSTETLTLVNFKVEALN